MKIESLKLKNYRNYSDLDINFSPFLNIFIGDNAQGKSNILESVFVLALTKSYMNIKDNNLIMDGKDFARIQAKFASSLEINSEIVIAGSSKKLKINGNEIFKYSDYISRIKVLIFSPYNVNFVKDGPNVRRKNINMVISQLSNSYVKLLQNYNAVLKKRNQFLKNIEILNEFNQIYLDAINDRFCSLAVDVFLARYEFVNNINKHISDIYKEITDFDNLDLKYISSVDYFDSKEVMIRKFKEKLVANIDKEKLYGMTLIGPHRDDFSFLLNGKDLSIYGSQGQIRAAILSMKLSEIYIFRDRDGDYPILLLDDIFSELDVNKRNKLVKYILDDVQTIITTTDIDMIDDDLVKKARVFRVNDGNVSIEEKEGMQK